MKGMKRKEILYIFFSLFSLLLLRLERNGRHVKRFNRKYFFKFLSTGIHHRVLTRKCRSRVLLSSTAQYGWDTRRTSLQRDELGWQISALVMTMTLFHSERRPIASRGSIALPKTMVLLLGDASNTGARIFIRKYFNFGLSYTISEVSLSFFFYLARDFLLVVERYFHTHVYVYIYIEKYIRIHIYLYIDTYNM